MITRLSNKLMSRARPMARAAIVHELKCWPAFYEAIARGEKLHDLRRCDDRDFRVGDRLKLLEFVPETETYTGRQQQVQISFITAAFEPCALSDQALHEDFCILSIVPVSDS